MFAKAATTLFLVSPLASTSKKSQKVYRIVGLNSPTYPHFSWYLGSHGNPVHTGVRGPCWRSQTSCSMSLLAQDLVLARNIHYRGVMIPALDLCQESDFQLFGDSKSGFESSKKGIITPIVIQEGYLISNMAASQVLWTASSIPESMCLDSLANLWGEFLKVSKKVAMHWSQTLSGASMRRMRRKGGPFRRPF